MELKFLGIGSAFQTKLYNTSAFFVEGDVLFLIDCGETTFEQLKSQSFFEDIKEIYVAFTHTHSDHIAGIAKLIDYCNDLLNEPLNIVVPTNSGLIKDIFALLDIFFISNDKCCFIPPNYLTSHFETFEKLDFLPTFHAPQLAQKCYSLLFDTKDGKVLYSGDSTDTKYIKELVKSGFDKMYIDVTSSIPIAHLDINVLAANVPSNLRNKVYCMHFDSQDCLNKAKYLGFNIANSIATKLSNIPLTFSYAKFDNTTLVLNNCNELAFYNLQQYNLLDGIDTIILMIQDTKASSVASLGSLLTYSHFVLKKPLYICNKNIAFNMLRLAKIYGVSETSLVFVDDNITVPIPQEEKNIYKIFDIVVCKDRKIATKYVDSSLASESSWIPLTKEGNYKVTTLNGRIGYNFANKGTKYVFVDIGDLILESFDGKDEICIYQLEYFDFILQKAIGKLLFRGNPKTNKKFEKYEKVAKDLDDYQMFVTV